MRYQALDGLHVQAFDSCYPVQPRIGIYPGKALSRYSQTGQKDRL